MPAGPVNIEGSEALYLSAYMRGEALDGERALLNVSFGCEDPVLRTVTQPALRSVVGTVPPRAMAVRAECRRCSDCLRRRAARWRDRAMIECGLWPRTFVGTLTLTPDAQFLARAECARHAEEEGVDWGSLPSSERFLAVCECVGQEVTRWLKRCRKAGLKLRYLLVAEAHKSGDPHFHVLVHEVDRFTSDAFDTYRTLKTQWQLGFSDFSGVRSSEGAAIYLCKYLSKSMLARVRASLAYGRIA